MSSLVLFLTVFLACSVEAVEALTIILAAGTTRHWGSALQGAGAALVALAATVAVLLVTAVGFAVRAPLAKVPENTMKFAVGTMLTSFGVFWSTEGTGAHWPGSDASLLVLVPVVALVALGYTALLRRSNTATKSPVGAPTGVPAEGSLT